MYSLLAFLLFLFGGCMLFLGESNSPGFDLVALTLMCGGALYAFTLYKFNILGILPSIGYLGSPKSANNTPLKDFILSFAIGAAISAAIVYFQKP